MKYTQLFCSSSRSSFFLAYPCSSFLKSVYFPIPLFHDFPFHPLPIMKCSSLTRPPPFPHSQANYMHPYITPSIFFSKYFAPVLRHSPLSTPDEHSYAVRHRALECVWATPPARPTHLLFIPFSLVSQLVLQLLPPLPFFHLSPVGDLSDVTESPLSHITVSALLFIHSFPYFMSPTSAFPILLFLCFNILQHYFHISILVPLSSSPPLLPLIPTFVFILFPTPVSLSSLPVSHRTLLTVTSSSFSGTISFFFPVVLLSCRDLYFVYSLLFPPPVPPFYM